MECLPRLPARSWRRRSTHQEEEQEKKKEKVCWMEPEAAGAPVGHRGLTTPPEGHSSVRKEFRDVQFNTMMMSSGCSRKGSLADGAGGRRGFRPD